MTSEQEEQKLRKEVLRNDQLVREKAAEERRASTYLAMALADSELPGRFGNIARQHIVGASAGPTYPMQPADSPFHHDPTGNLPDPFGVDIDAMEAVGSEAEIQAAQRILDDQRSAAPPADGSSADVPAVSSLATAVEHAELATNSSDETFGVSATGPASTLSAPTDELAGPTSSKSPLTVGGAVAVVGDAGDSAANSVPRSSFNRRL